MREVYESGDLRIDLGRMSATRAGAPIPLEPKAFDVLRYLLEHRDRVVTKDELLDAVWTGTFVTPNVLTRAIAQIRKALGDETENVRFIETIAKRGYRFIAPVAVVPFGGTGGVGSPSVPSLSPEARQAPALRPKSRRNPFALGAAALILLMAAAGFVVFRSGQTREGA